MRVRKAGQRSILDFLANNSVDNDGGEDFYSESIGEKKESIIDSRVYYRSSSDNWIVSKMVFRSEPRLASVGDRGYLLQTYYDGSRGCIVAKIFEPVSGEILLYIDKSGYLPYFLTDLEPDKVREISGVTSDSSFVRVDVVEKFDLLRWRSIRVSKIVVKTPDSVPRLRGKFPRVWEANIKFHHNFIHDHGLVPGMLYKVSEEGLVAEWSPPRGVDAEKIASIFSGEDPDTIKMAIEWFPLFEEEPPRPKRLAVDIEVYTPFKGRVPDASSASYPVISVAFAGDDGFRAVYILVRPGLPISEEIVEKIGRDLVVEFFEDEETLILEVFRLISSYPVVVTFNGDNFDFLYLYNRALKLGIPRDIIPFRIVGRGGEGYISLKYGVHIDLYQFFSIKAIQTYAFGNAYKEFTLDAIAEALLSERKVSVEGSISDISLEELIRYNLRDAELTLKLISFKKDLVWKLIVLLMRISKLPIEDVTRSQVSSWIKNLLYWEHRRRGYLIPDRDEIIRIKGRTRSEALIKGKKYQGAIVLDPPSGVYFDVLVLDFASLYPSIIKKWNLSYETVNPEKCPGDKLAEVPDVGHRVCMSIKGLIAQIVGLLRDYRVRMYKRKAKDSSIDSVSREWYDTVQSAMKVFINASYGVFGASTFPFYAPPMAESVTAIGRYTIRQTLDKTSELGLKVLYGDTDSLFIWKPSNVKLEELKKFVENEIGLDLEIDKIYRFVTFSGLKKNYVGVVGDYVDVKGLVAKKRNAPEFLKREFNDILSILASVKSVEDFIKARTMVLERVREVYRKVKDVEYNLDDLAIHVALNKPISEYTKNTPQHVKVAKQLVTAGIQVMPGDVIVFVKVKGRDGVKAIQLAKLVEIDVDKYIEMVKNTFEQLLLAINLSWDDIVGSSRLEYFWGRKRRMR